EADLVRRPGEPEAAATAARGLQQAGGGEPLGELLRGRQRHAGLLGEQRRGQPHPRRAARRGGHHHDGIIGKARQSHRLSSALPRRPNRSPRAAKWERFVPIGHVGLSRGGIKPVFAAIGEASALAAAASAALAGEDFLCHRRGAMAFYPLVRPLAFAPDAERAHRLTIALLARTKPRLPPPADPALAVRVAGLDFASPVGLAAGFDKDAEAWRQLLGLGFGFVEAGTLTPRPQAGNERPRLFRLVEDRAAINRMGFNNRGQAEALARLAGPSPGIVGVNIGANKENVGGAAAIADYAAGVRAMTGVADYLTVNISSPNTPGLRALQDAGALDALLEAVIEARGAGPPGFLQEIGRAAA